MSDEELPWTEEFDVIVIGGGGGGMAAALTAAIEEPDADITLLQKINELGGSTTMSMGIIAAPNTYLQREADINDSPEQYFDDIGTIVENFQDGSGRYYYVDFQGDLEEKDNLELRQVLCANAGETVDWLHEQGIEYAGPYPDPGMVVPRCLQVQPGTEAYAAVLGDRLREYGVDLKFGTEAYELIDDEDGITGVLAQQPGSSSPLILKARRGIVLATGDYVNSQELRREFTSDAESPPINQHNSGDGHRMAREFGAELCNMDIQWLMLRVGDPYWMIPEIATMVDRGGILVTSEGERVINEEADYDLLYRSVFDQVDQSYYLLFDDEIGQQFTEWPHYISTYGEDGKIWAFLDDYLETDYASKANTIPELAADIGAEPGSLRKTVETYNDGVYDEIAEATIDPFGRERTKDLEKRPYYQIGPLRPYSGLTDGGIAVSTEMEVLTQERTPIEGLYAAGTMAGDHHLFGHGQHHSWIFVSGRIAGEKAVQE